MEAMVLLLWQDRFACFSGVEVVTYFQIGTHPVNISCGLPEIEQIPLFSETIACRCKGSVDLAKIYY